MKNLNTTICKGIGYILLTPAVASVAMFFIGILAKNKHSVLGNLNSAWTFSVDTYGENYGAGATSALPFYFGLMAIAGAYLIKNAHK